MVLLLALIHLKSGHTFDCCKAVESATDSFGSDRLINCVKKHSEEAYRSSLHNAVPYLAQHGGQGPSLAVSVLSRATENVYHYASYSLFLQSLYAQQNGYIYLPASFYDDHSEGDYQYHRKLSPMIQALSAPQRTSDGTLLGGEAFFSDYLVWMDADAAVLNLGFRFESLAASFPKAHIIVSRDSSSMVNTGIVFVRNSEWSLQFLKDWRSKKDGANPPSTDQAGFVAVYSEYDDSAVPGLREKIVILKEHELNSVFPAFTRQQPSHNFIHLAAESASFRESAFRRGAKTACEAASTLEKAPVYMHGRRLDAKRLLSLPAPDWEGAGMYAQLGLAQPRLLEEALRAYRADAMLSLAGLRRALSLDEDVRDSGGAGCMRSLHLEVSRLDLDLARVRSTVSKYCHALENSQEARRPTVELSPLMLRQTAYRLVAEWVGMLQRLVDEQHAWLSQRERSGVSSSSAGSSVPGSADGDPRAFFVYTPTHKPSQHRQLGGNREDTPFSEYDETGLVIDPEREHGVSEERERLCAENGRAMTVAVHGFLGCAQLKSFVNPVTNQHQHSYCTRSKADIVLERLPENMKLAAELAFDYLVALSRAEPEHARGLLLAHTQDVQGVDITALLREEKEEVEDYLTALLASLQVAVHHSQAIIVADMTAGLMLQLAEMSLKERNAAIKTRSASRGELQALTDKAASHYRRALKLYLGMQGGDYTGDGGSGGRGEKGSNLSLRDLSPSLASLGIDLRAVSSAASSLGSLSCEQGHHRDGITLFDRAAALDAYYHGYSEQAEVTDSTLLLLPHLYNLAACHRAANDSGALSSKEEAEPSFPSPLSLATPATQWHLSLRSERELLTFMMELYGVGYARDLPSVEAYVSLAEAAATRLSTAV